MHSFSVSMCVCFFIGLSLYRDVGQFHAMIELYKLFKEFATEHEVVKYLIHEAAMYIQENES